MTSYNKFRILLDFERGDLTLSQTADTLQARTQLDVMKMLAAYRAYLPYLIEQSDKLSEQLRTAHERRQIIEEVADRLGITYRQVNRIFSRSKITTPSPLSIVMKSMKSEETKEKWKTRYKSALSIIAGSDTMESAATSNDVSTRQMYRWATKILKVEGTALRDLKNMSMENRRGVAHRIEERLGTDYELYLNGPRPTRAKRSKKSTDTGNDVGGDTTGTEG